MGRIAVPETGDADLVEIGQRPHQRNKGAARRQSGCSGRILTIAGVRLALLSANLSANVDAAQQQNQ
jgi:hypothetical protein